ncbi:DMT family transporter [Natrinema ejinorense]|nr:EamA family transporter [Natrinema ejinorense]
MTMDIGIAFAIVAALGLAVQALTVRVATLQGRSSDVLFVVLVVNTVLLAPIAAFSSLDSQLPVSGMAAFAVAGILGTAVGRAFLFEGIKTVGASRAEPIKASTPLHATVLSVLVLGESVTGLQFVGVLTIIGGIAVITWDGSAASRATPEGVPWTGLALPFAAAFCFGLEPIFASIGFREGVPLFVGLAVQAIAGLLAYAVYLTWIGSLPTVGRLRAADLRWYVFAGLSSTTFIFAYYVGLSVSTVGVVVPIMQTSPLVVVLLSVIFLRKLERVTPTVIAAAGIIVTGGVLVALAG